ncbi:MAG TPA: hypothetical protein VGM33_00555 [Baekduia sp.]
MSEQQDPFNPIAAEPAAPGAEPTPTVGAADATFGQPAGSALLDGAPAGAPAYVDPNPEKLVGAAFAGGLVAAFVLKRLAKRRHR